MVVSSDSSIPTRQRLVTAAAELFRRQGYAGTGIKAILTAAGAPYGSLYHFFPGGKAELGRAVIEEGGVAYRELVEAFYRDDVDSLDATRELFEGGADLLESTGYADACPIATIAGEISDTHEAMRAAAAAAFGSWTATLADHLVAHGSDPARANATGSNCSVSSKAPSCTHERPGRRTPFGSPVAEQWPSSPRQWHQSAQRQRNDDGESSSQMEAFRTPHPTTPTYSPTATTADVGRRPHRSRVASSCGRH